jgi:O-antigen ligase
VQQHVAAAGSIGKFGLLAIFAFMVIVVFRLHELLPRVILLVRPALVMGPLVLWYVWRHSSPAIRMSMTRDKIMRGVAFYFCWAVLSVPFSLYPRLAYDTTFGFFPLLLLTAVVALLPANRRNLDAVLFMLMAGGGLLGIAALAVGNTSGGRLQVTQSLDPNDLAAMMAMTAPLALGLAFRVKGWRRLCAIAVIFITALVIVRTDSRGSSIGFAVGMIMVILLSRGTRRLVGLLLVAVGAVVLWNAAPSSYKERMQSLNDVGSDYNATDYYGRKQVWKRGLEYAATNPILGVGVGCFPVAEGNRLAKVGMRGKWSASHNAYVQALAELGFPGGLTFLFIMFSSMRMAIRWSSWNRSRPVPPDEQRPELAACMFGLAVASFFLSFAYFWAWFAIWGICSLAGRAYIGALAHGGSVTKAPAGQRRLMRRGSGMLPAAS